VKQEPEESDLAHGGRASRAISAVAEQANPLAELEVEPPRINGSFELQLLHCAVAVDCFRPLKPPLFKVTPLIDSSCPLVCFDGSAPLPWPFTVERFVFL
jgi:hypothetical protein